MTLVSLGHEMRWGRLLPTVSPVLFGTSSAMDAAGEALAFVVQAPKTGNISAIIPYVDAVTTPEDVLMTIETITAGGRDPSGTLWDSPSNTTFATFDPTGTAGTSPEITLDSGAVAEVTLGDLFAIRFEWAGTAGNLSWRLYTGSSNCIRQLPKTLQDTGSGFSATGRLPTVCLKYDDGTYHVPLGCAPPTDVVSEVVDLTNTREAGLYITPPATMRVVGLEMQAQTSAIFANEYDVTVYTDPAGTPTVHDTRAFVGNLGPSAAGYFSFFFDPIVLNAGTPYVIAISNPDATADFTFVTFSGSSANLLGQNPGQLCLAERTGYSGAFTKTTTKMPLATLLIDQIDDGAGSGGGSFPRVQIDGVLG